MIFWVFFSHSTSKMCPHGTEYYKGSVVQKDIAENQWFYIFGPNMLEKHPLILVIMSNATIKIYNGKLRECPNEESDVLAVILGNQQIHRVHIPIAYEKEAVSIGIHTTHPTHFDLSFDGYNPPSNGLYTAIKLFSVFIIMVIITYVLFIKYILPKKDIKND